MSDARLIIANPKDVAAADQAAAALGTTVKVQLTSWVEPGKAYVVGGEESLSDDVVDEIARKLGDAP